MPVLHRYFACAPLHGLFAPLHKVEPLHGGGAQRSSYPPPGPAGWPGGREGAEGDGQPGLDQFHWVGGVQRFQGRRQAEAGHHLIGQQSGQGAGLGQL